MRTLDWQTMVSGFLFIAFPFLPSCDSSSAGIKSRRSLAELKTHGDIIVYVSPSRHIARFVSAYRNELDSEISTLSASVKESVKISEVATSDALAEFCENKEDLEGDMHRYVHSQCQARDPDPCDDNCVALAGNNSQKDFMKVSNFGRCQRVKRLSESCSEEYKEICERYKYFGTSKCDTQGTSMKKIFEWYCKAAQ